jgi:hypothetical protein
VLSLSSTTFVRNIFLSDKYLMLYVGVNDRDELRNASIFSCKVSIVIT